VQKTIYKRPQISEIGSLWSSVLDLVDVDILRLFVSSKPGADAYGCVVMLTHLCLQC